MPATIYICPKCGKEARVWIRVTHEVICYSLMKHKYGVVMKRKT